jgi:hypothetical protein
LAVGLDDLGSQLVLDAIYERLSTYCRAVRDDVIQNYQNGQWREIARQMDSLEEDERTFGRRTLLTGEHQFMREASRLSQRATELIRRATSLLGGFDHQLRKISDELARLDTLKEYDSTLVVSDADSEVERVAVRLVHGWRALKEQTGDLKRRLEERADKLEERIADDVFDRLMIGIGDRLPDKDIGDD